MGRPSRAMKKFIERLSELDLKSKMVAVFGTYAGTERPFGRSVKKLEKMVEKKLPNLTLLSPSLSVRVIRIPGPIAEAELPKCLDFGRKIAVQLKM
jgi:flavorubredoxin